MTATYSQTSEPNWEWKLLSDVCADRVESRNPADDPDASFQYVDIGSVNNIEKVIKGTKTLIGRNAPSRARQVIRTNDVLVATTRPSLNAVALVPASLDGQICSTGFCVLRPKPELHSEFLYCWVRSPKFIHSVTALVQGALYPAVSDRQVRAQYIPVPSLDEQRRIAAIVLRQLTDADLIRRAAESQLSEIRNVSAALLNEWFSGPEIAGAPRKALGVLVVRQGGLADGPFGSHLKSEHYTQTGARVIRLQNIGRGDFLDADRAFVSAERYENLIRHSVRPRDVVIAALGDGARPAGRACVVPESLGPALVKADCFRVRVRDEEILPEFLSMYLNSSQGLSWVAGRIRGATRPRVNLDILRGMPIPVPPKPVQQWLIHHFEQQREHVARMEHAAAEQMQTLQSVPAVLLKEAFSAAEHALLSAPAATAESVA